MSGLSGTRIEAEWKISQSGATRTKVALSLLIVEIAWELGISGKAQDTPLVHCRRKGSGNEFEIRAPLEQ